MDMTEELIERLEKVVKELKEQKVEQIKPCKHSYKSGEWNDLSSLNLYDIYMEPCIFSTQKLNSLSHIPSYIVTIGFISSDDPKFIYTNREDVDNKFICELLGKYCYVMKLSDLKW